MTGKPYGVYGVTASSVSEDLRALLDGASFVYCRETKSVANLNEAGVKAAELGFTPDAVFAMTSLDEERAADFLKRNQLGEKRFVCVVPRLRYTPYHLLKKVNWSDEKIHQVMTVNEKYKEIDHAKLREAIVRWVRETGGRVLLCPEMTYQIDLLRPLLFDPLPDDVKDHVVLRETYWLPNEAASVYRRAFAVISLECHSPIIAASQGTPCLYVRQPEDTIKGQMYYDIGLDDWVFEIDQTEGSQIADRVMKAYRDPEGAARYLAAAMEKVAARHEETMRVVRRSAGL